MLTRVNETSGLLNSKVVIVIPRTIQDEINDCLTLLRKEKWGEQVQYGSLISLSTVLALLAAAGSVFSIIKLVTMYECGTEPDLIAAYMDHKIYGYPPNTPESTCGVMFPLSDIYDYDSVPHNFYIDGNNQTALNFWTMALQCYTTAQRAYFTEYGACLTPFLYVCAIGCAAFAAALTGAGIMVHRSPGKIMRELTTLDNDLINATAVKLNITINPDQSITDVLNLFEKKLLMGDSYQVSPTNLFSFTPGRESSAVVESVHTLGNTKTG